MDLKTKNMKEGHNAIKQSTEPRADRKKIKEMRSHVINMMSHLNGTPMEYKVQKRLLREVKNTVEWLITELDIEIMFNDFANGD